MTMVLTPANTVLVTYYLRHITSRWKWENPSLLLVLLGELPTEYRGKSKCQSSNDKWAR